MPILEVHHIEKHFGATRVLEDISFDLEQGQALAIIGSSGSGKTTLLRCLNFLETPDQGQIVVQGDTLFDAAFMAQDLLTLWISQALREGRPLPEPRMDHPTPANGKAIAVAVECDADTPSLTTMTVQEAADTLDVSTSRIHAMIRDGILRTEKVGSARLVSADDVIDYFNSPRTAGRPKKVATA